MPEHLALDILRWFILSLAAVLIGFSIAVMVEARKFRMPPYHVWSIAISYMILVIVLAIEVHERLGTPTSWRTWAVLVAYAFGIWSQVLMYRAYNFAARLRRHEKVAVEEGNRIMGQVFRRMSRSDRDEEDRQRRSP